MYGPPSDTNSIVCILESCDSLCLRSNLNKPSNIELMKPFLLSGIQVIKYVYSCIYIYISILF